MIIFNNDLNTLESIRWAYDANNRTISIFNIQQVSQIQLFDLNGNSLNRINNYSNQIILDLKDLIPGLYFIQLFNEKEQK